MSKLKTYYIIYENAPDGYGGYYQKMYVSSVPKCKVVGKIRARNIQEARKIRREQLKGGC